MTISEIYTSAPAQASCEAAARVFALLDELGIPYTRVEHDAAEPLGFYISHPELGRLLFMTDLRAVPFTRYIVPMTVMIEANWSGPILDGRVDRGEEDISRAARIKETHLSLERACDFVRGIDGPALQDVVLLHLSDRNSDAEAFAAKMRKAVRLANVHVASAGLTIELNKNAIL